jgi:hypothetical protein
MAEPFKQRCYLVYAVAPASVSASDANDALNAYVGDQARGIAVFHDHFARSPHGGIAVFDVRSEDELAMLERPGPLARWQLHVHALTFSLSTTGFTEQTRLTVREYGKTSLDALREAEPQDPRFWWQRHRHSRPRQ